MNHHMPNQSHWDCSWCTLKNKRTDRKCRVCKAPSPSPDPEPQSPTNWSCSACTFDNKSHHDHCLVCRAPKPAHDTPGEWACPVCTLSNRLEDDQCHACTAPKPPAHLEEEIDALAGGAAPTIGAPAHHLPCKWSCPRCTFNNGPEDDKCWVCDGDKPEGFYHVAEPYDALAGYGAHDAPTPEEDPFQVVEFPESLEDEATTYRRQLDQTIGALGEVERDLGEIRIRAGLGVATAALSPEQAQARRELDRAEMLQKYLQDDVLRMRIQCTQLRIQQLDMS